MFTKVSISEVEFNKMDSRNTRLNITIHTFHRRVTREETNDNQNKSEKENVGDLNNA